MAGGGEGVKGELGVTSGTWGIVEEARRDEDDRRMYKRDGGEGTSWKWRQ